MNEDDDDQLQSNKVMGQSKYASCGCDFDDDDLQKSRGEEEHSTIHTHHKQQQQ